MIIDILKWRSYTRWTNSATTSPYMMIIKIGYSSDIEDVWEVRGLLCFCLHDADENLQGERQNMFCYPVHCWFLLQLQQVFLDRGGTEGVSWSIMLLIWEGMNHGATLCFQLRQSMKNSRKIFKFLKFLEQISSIVKNIESKKPLYVKIVAVL